MSISLKTPHQTVHQRPLFRANVSDAWSKKVLSFCIVFIVCVSIYDTYLILIYPDGILSGELNPMCRFLIRQDQSYFSWFIGGKLIGNIMVVGVLLGLYYFRFRHVLTVAKGVAFFQLSLLAFLHSGPYISIVSYRF